jgi:hypothetical protein
MHALNNSKLRNFHSLYRRAGARACVDRSLIARAPCTPQNPIITLEKIRMPLSIIIAIQIPSNAAQTRSSESELRLEERPASEVTN